MGSWLERPLANWAQLGVLVFSGLVIAASMARYFL